MTNRFDRAEQSSLPPSLMLLVALLSASALAGLSPLSRAVPSVAPRAASGGEVRFLAVGDWGGQTGAPYTTPGEVEVAAQMGKTAAAEGSSFVLALGDNFYSEGVQSVDDPRFNETFERVFTADSLQVPWYVIVGNHDWRPGPKGPAAEIAYSKRNPRWHFPARYYSFVQGGSSAGGGPTVEFVMIDTVTLAVDDPDQLRWINSTLAASTADWVVVGGHYPVYSAAEHGPTPPLIDYLLPLLDEHGVAVYTCGHDHDMAHYRVEGSAVEFLHTGAGHNLEFSMAHLDDIPGGSLKYFFPSADPGERQMDDDPTPQPSSAFASVRVNATHLTATYISGLGRELYSFSTTNPRSEAGFRKRRR